MNYGFKQTFRFVPKIASVDSDSSRRVIVESVPSYSEQAACVVLGASMVELRRLKRDGLIRSEVRDDYTESELRTLHEEITELQERGEVIE